MLDVWLKEPDDVVSSVDMWSSERAKAGSTEDDVKQDMDGEKKRDLDVAPAA